MSIWRSGRAALGWNDVALFDIFENGHIAADQVYFFVFKFLKIVEFGGDHSGRTAKFSFRILVVYFRVIVKIKKLKNIISNLNLGIWGL